MSAIQEPDNSPFNRKKNILSKSTLDIAEILSGDFWNELRVFLAVAKGKSYARASGILNISTKTVARRVKRLKDVLGVSLVEQTAQGIILTEEGLALAQQCADLDYRLFKISQKIRPDENAVKTFVSVGVTDALGAFFISPSLFRFSRANPDIGVDIKTLVNASNIRDNNVDVMISPVPLPGADIAVEKVGAIHFCPMVSEYYTAVNGHPNTNNIEDHWFIHTDFFDSDFWSKWRDLVNRGSIRARTDSSISYGTMVKTGLGIGLLGSYMAIDPLLHPLFLEANFSSPLYIVCLKENLTQQPVRTVRSWLMNMFSSENPWFSDEINIAVDENDFDYGIRRMLNV